MTYVCYLIAFLFLVSCQEKTNYQEKCNHQEKCDCQEKARFAFLEALEADTTYHGEYRYLSSLYGMSTFGTKTMLNSDWKTLSMDSRFRLLTKDERYKVIQLMRAANIYLNIECSGDIYFEHNFTGYVTKLIIHPRAIYGRFPLDLIFTFDSLKTVNIGLCPNDIEIIVSKMRHLEKLEVIPQSIKPYSINLSAVDMTHLKELRVYGTLCRSIIFPKENKLERLYIGNADLDSLDFSWQNLKSLNYLLFSHTLLKKLDLKGLNSLDTLVLRQPKELTIRPNSIKNLSSKTKVEYREANGQGSYDCSSWVKRGHALTDTIYVKFVKAAGCD